MPARIPFRNPRGGEPRATRPRTGSASSAGGEPKRSTQDRGNRLLGPTTRRRLATTGSVVWSLLIMLIANATMTAIFFFA